MLDGQIEVRLADRFPPHVDGAEFLDRGAQIAALVVDGRRGAELLADLQFLVAAGGGEDSRADGPGHLNDAGADSARAAVNEDVFAHLQIRQAEAAEMGGDAGQRQRGGIGIGHFVGRVVEPAFFDGGIFGEGALPAEQALIASPNAIAGLESFHVGPDGFDHARQVATDDERLGQIEL